MGQKIRPNSLRLGIVEDWNARWYPKQGLFRDMLEEDEAIRDVVHKRIGIAGVSRIEIERTAGNYKVFIKAARPGLIIGRGGKGIEELRAALEAALKKLWRKRNKGEEKRKFSFSLNVEELKRTEISAVNVAQNIAWDLEKRLPFRRTLKKHLASIMQNRDAKGAKIKLSGRLDGAEISRREWLGTGKIPLQTLRAWIDYGEATAFASYGTVGVKVWIYKGEVFEKPKK
ncbi:MAG: 30S ribosomal protein S3 [Candidatus Harrisonbacteria bacterium]|nr:30S ribosomal protein S3 [Candidatus Harrisonbacteria bacterium]MBI2406116.1 30S ribosomal protein S3 [Candidatus Harrisonbacteria bacterium]MBI2604001.1 30S ribosomal protein S3 [Candidatus Harrisonbacteria bacterium]MBI3114457.1 30S ribosomal protein S3 [Candidatus Harrisonbacteria bacterium]